MWKNSEIKLADSHRSHRERLILSLNARLLINIKAMHIQIKCRDGNLLNFKRQKRQARHAQRALRLDPECREC